MPCVGGEDSSALKYAADGTDACFQAGDAFWAANCRGPFRKEQNVCCFKSACSCSVELADNNGGGGRELGTSCRQGSMD